MGTLSIQRVIPMGSLLTQRVFNQRASKGLLRWEMAMIESSKQNQLHDLNVVNVEQKLFSIYSVQCKQSYGSLQMWSNTRT